MNGTSITLRLLSTVKVTATTMEYELLPVDSAALPNPTDGRTAEILVDVVAWPGAGANLKTYLTRQNGVPQPIRRLIFDLLQLDKLPNRFRLTLAWVDTDPLANSGMRPTDSDELVIYDCARTDHDAILHGMFAENARAAHDLLTIADNIKSVAATAPEAVAWCKRAGFVSHEVMANCRKRDGNIVHIELDDTLTFHRYPMGEYCRVLPVPPFPANLAHNPKVAVVVANCSPEGAFRRDAATWRALERVNEVVRSAKQTILLTASPGCGKELYAKAIHALTGHAQDGVLRGLSTAGVPFDTLRELLCGRDIAGVDSPGDIDKARGGTLLIDEFDKACQGDEEQLAFYKWLLRVLEAGEYRAEGGSQIKRVEDVSWIFAGAFAGGTHANMPPDFWSRLTSHIHLPDAGETLDALIGMFLYFYFASVVSLVEDGEAITPHDLTRPSPTRYNVGVVREVAGVEGGETQPIAPTKEVLRFARRLAQFIQGGRPSPRAVRQAARAAAQSLLFAAKGFDDPKTIWDDRWQDQALLAAWEVARISAR